MSKLEQMRHAILAADDLDRRPVSVPEWGLEDGLFVRSMTITEAVAFEAGKGLIEDQKAVALYLAYVLCDEGGHPVFRPGEDVEALCGKAPQVLLRIFNEAMRLNDGEPADAGGAGSPGE